MTILSRKDLKEQKAKEISDKKLLAMAKGMATKWEKKMSRKPP